MEIVSEAYGTKVTGSNISKTQYADAHKNFFNKRNDESLKINIKQTNVEAQQEIVCRSNPKDRKTSFNGFEFIPTSNPSTI